MIGRAEQSARAQERAQECMQQEALEIFDRRQTCGKHTTGEGRWALPRELASASGSTSSVPLARLPVRTRDALSLACGAAHTTPRPARHPQLNADSEHARCAGRLQAATHVSANIPIEQTWSLSRGHDLATVRNKILQLRTKYVFRV
jgi:hypothetical protein